MGGYVVMVGYPMVVCVARLVSSTYRTPTYHRPSFFLPLQPGSRARCVVEGGGTVVNMFICLF